MSFFEHAKEYPPDPIFGIGKLFNEDTRAEKVDLSVGIYRNHALAAEVLPSVKEAEKIFTEKESEKTYLPISGDPRFVDLIKEQVFGGCIDYKNIFGAQTPGGTSALRIGADFLLLEGFQRIAIPTPTWANHKSIFSAARLEVENYSYYDGKKRSINFQDLLDHLPKIPNGTCILFHASCHNPTGCDPTKEQWQQILDICRHKKFIPFFDCAYQGLGDGFEEDVFPIRLFARSGLEMLVAYSCSKNFGLYGERTGAFFLVTQNPDIAGRTGSGIKHLIRSNYSNPPRHGSGLVITILSDKKRKAQWLADVTHMRQRIRTSIETFADRLTRQTGLDYAHLKKCRGMFCYTGLSENQVHKMKDQFGIYMPSSGRINVTGLNDQNIDYVIEAFTQAIRG